MPQEFYTDGSPSRTEIEYVDGPLTRFADDATIAELERQARRIAELEAALSGIRDQCASRAPHDRIAADAIAALAGVPAGRTRDEYANRKR